MTPLANKLRSVAITLSVIALTSLLAGVLTLVKGTKPDSFFERPIAGSMEGSQSPSDGTASHCAAVQDRLIRSLNRVGRKLAYFLCIISVVSGSLAVYVNRIRCGVQRVPGSAA